MDKNNLQSIIEKIEHMMVDEVTQKIGDRLSSIVLFGSVARNDYVPGWSDLDVMIFLKGSKISFEDLMQIKKGCECLVRANQTATLETYIFTKSICEKVIRARKKFGIGVHLLIYSEKEFYDGLAKHPDFPPLFLYGVCKDRKCLYGCDPFLNIILPERVEPMNLLSNESGLYDIRIRLRNTCIDYNVETHPEIFARDSIYCIFTAARSSLLMIGLDEFTTTKKDICEKFKRNFATFSYKNVIDEAFYFRQHYHDLKNDLDYVRTFYKKALSFVDGLIEYVQQCQKK